ncbi:MAG TPA: hypothetical protein VK804_30375 [Bradyrhizobium sp.]|uniref:hypothetical protein n=1 Tax=Bradyrhizobium sp. TaxID=376 RepID=UPI002CE1584C|nr:hypothetical protein [Bradyrhizobium sp.]HTB04798.1 hypothetical protein [Bradyrhizobium sp.]
MARDRVFGFEINAANFTAVAFSQVMLTDVHKKIHYQKTALQPGVTAGRKPIRRKIGT